MKLFVGSLIAFCVLATGIIGGLAAASPTLMSGSMTLMCLFGNPLLAVAVYRMFTGAAGWSLRVERTNGRQQPALKSRRATDLEKALGG